MKRTIYIVTFAILTSCGQSSPDQKSEHKISATIDTSKVDDRKEASNIQEPIETKSTDNNDYQSQSLDYEFKNATLFQLTESISADFNGDEQVDKATFRKENGTSGIIIKHGHSNEEVKIGFGEQFAHLTDFNWVDFWGLVKDSTTYEIIIEEAEIIGDTTVRLENPSIVVRKEELGGGLITFRNGKYEWVHQAD